MKKGTKIILGIIIAFAVVFFGSAAIVGIYQGITGTNSKTDITPTSKDSEEVKMLTDKEKEELKNKVAEKVKDKNVTDISILTENGTGKPIISMQLKGDIDKADVNKEEAEKLAYDLENRVKDISDKTEIQLIDKNDQVILLYKNKEIEYN